jgi:hypothetical protein
MSHSPNIVALTRLARKTTLCCFARKQRRLLSGMLTKGLIISFDLNPNGLMSTVRRLEAAPKPVLIKIE